MNDEQAFLRAILADPRDHATRRVYADWLEERGDPVSLHRAEYLRTECELDGLPSRDRRRRRLRARLLELSRVVGDDWWRELDGARVEYCVEFAYRCPQRWDTLTPTDNEAVRHCPACQRNVHYCRSATEALDLADAGECVAIDSRQVRLPLALLHRRREGGRMLLGKVAPRRPARLPLNERGPRAGGE
jgi:uncharacterized protein (TIGR02996 family)